MPDNIPANNEPTNGGKVTTQQFYTELLKQSIERADMERRIMARLDDICAHGTPVMVERITQVEGQVKELANAVEVLEKSVAPLVQANKVLTWVAVAFGGSIVALIWGILVHQIQITIP